MFVLTAARPVELGRSCGYGPRVPTFRIREAADLLGVSDDTRHRPELLTDRVRAQIRGTPSALVDITPDAVADLDLANGKTIWLSTKATDIDVYSDPT